MTHISLPVNQEELVYLNDVLERRAVVAGKQNH